MLTVRQAADVAGVHPQTLRRWEKAGHITARRTPGNQRRYRRADVEQLVAERAS